MTKFYIIRHAQAEGNVKQVFQGISDLPLTELGKKQVEVVSERLKNVPFNAIYSSSLSRAWDTAKGIAAPHGLYPNQFDKVIEINGGLIENLTFDKVKELYPIEYDQFVNEPHRFPRMGTGESMLDVYDRIRDAYIELAQRHKDENIAVVSHGVAIRCILCYASGRPLEQINKLNLPWGNNTSISVISFDNYLNPTIELMADESHILGEL